MIKKWYSESEKMGPIRMHLIESIRDKNEFGSTDFLIIIQALEGFWNRFRESEHRCKNNIPQKKNIKLRDILEDVISEFENIDKISRLNIDISSVVDSKHYYSHFMNISKNQKL